jgi:hypothetical protein
LNMLVEVKGAYEFCFGCQELTLLIARNSKLDAA